MMKTNAKKDLAARSLGLILQQYSESFSSKEYGDENEQVDPLMNVFGSSPKLKRENRQYWGRELGMCWQLLVSRAFEVCRKNDFAPGYRLKDDELCDLMVARMAIDTKYRIGSGDSGTLKKFKQYGKKLRSHGLEPVMLILRSDNLPAAIQACLAGGWQTFVGQAAFEFIKRESGFDMFRFLTDSAKRHIVVRKPTTP
jgi:hypothetical protein